MRTSATQEMPSRSKEGIQDKFDTLKEEFSGLLRGTFALLRKELDENAHIVAKAAKTTLAGVVVLMLGALFVLIGLNLLVIDLLSPDLLTPMQAAWICTASTGIILLAGGFIFARRNAKRVSAERMVPHRTLQSLEQSFEWVTEKAEETIKR